MEETVKTHANLNKITKQPVAYTAVYSDIHCLRSYLPCVHTVVSALIAGACITNSIAYTCNDADNFRLSWIVVFKQLTATF